VFGLAVLLEREVAVIRVVSMVEAKLN